MHFIRTYFRACGWFWLSYVQRVPWVADEKKKKERIRGKKKERIRGQT